MKGTIWGGRIKTRPPHKRSPPTIQAPHLHHWTEPSQWTVSHAQQSLDFVIIAVFHCRSGPVSVRMILTFADGRGTAIINKKWAPTPGGFWSGLELLLLCTVWPCAVDLIVELRSPAGQSNRSLAGIFLHPHSPYRVPQVNLANAIDWNIEWIIN